MGFKRNGIDKDKLKLKAIDLKLVNKEEVETWTEDKILNLIYISGLSTAESTTMISGRGIGMDIIKERILKMGGTIQIKSVQGKFCNFFIKLPLD